MEEIMGRLDDLAATLADLQSDSAEVAARVAADFAFLKGQIADLAAKVDELTAGQVTDEEIAALQSLVGEIDTTINAIEDVPNEEPVPEPEPEPEV
jgi:hypothetical protein